MTSHLSHHNLELLKSKIKYTSGLENVSPADCKIISCLILKKTRCNISETTIKRIYGFAVSRFNPSLFTLDTLSIYCNYSGWEDFCEHQASSKITNDDAADWFNLQRNAAKITKFTIDAIKNRSGIPYNRTVSRSFIADHFNNFRESDYTGAVIAAPAGYGKSISLCQWVEQQVELNESKATNDVILFFSSIALVSFLLSGRDINYWLLGLLGYTSDKDINAIWDEKQRKGSRFYLVIDGFDEHSFKTDQFMLLLGQIGDLLALHRSNPWLKIILSMRSCTWINHRHELQANDNKWLTGFNTDEDCINVPLLNPAEIKTLCYKINPYLHQFIPIRLAADFDHPLFFQYYYKKYKENFSPVHMDHSAIYELIYFMVKSNIYSGGNAEEKALLTRELAECMDPEQDNHVADKLQIYDLISKHHTAYLELLSTGFLREVNESGFNHYHVAVKFSTPYFTSLGIAQSLLYKNKERFDTVLIKHLDNRFANNPIKLSLLKWCILHAISTEQQSNLVHLTELHLTPVEKCEIILFLGDVLNKMPLWQKEEIGDKLFEYFLGSELLHNDYKKTLKHLLEFNLSPKKRIHVYSLLAMLAIINLELDELYTYLIKLKDFQDEDMLFFAINPLQCLDAIYQFLKYGIVKKESLEALTKLVFTSPKNEHELRNCVTNDMLYMLGMYTLSICNNPKKSIRFIHAIRSFYKSDDLYNQTSVYGFMVKILSADAYFRLGDNDMVTALYYAISNAYEKSEGLMSPFMKTLFLSVKIKFMAGNHEDYAIMDEIKALRANSEMSGNKLSLLLILIFLMKNERFAVTHPTFYAQLYNDYKKMTYQCSVNTDLLSSHCTLVYK
ncbi:hypothetical protein HDF18_04270 [Mucilaginibacter sp. X5P1]|uniref:hypothetical protein n=1 Tax=Mucilaginibacter sp. X5P1 TaxID=2723088 RepID=UPI001608F4C9|nr:hypothetical protein [Mucilaginibacter sp. X5P1]MBB6136832.1 hypothetical protein [Mucilaginibacter sp. X5P1]